MSNAPSKGDGDLIRKVQRKLTVVSVKGLIDIFWSHLVAVQRKTPLFSAVEVSNETILKPVVVSVFK